MNMSTQPRLGRGPAGGREKHSEESKVHLRKLWRIMGRPPTQKIKQELMNMSKSTIDEFLKPA
jgi:hypothetical protein